MIPNYVSHVSEIPGCRWTITKTRLGRWTIVRSPSRSWTRVNRAGQAKDRYDDRTRSSELRVSGTKPGPLCHTYYRGSYSNLCDLSFVSRVRSPVIFSKIYALLSLDDVTYPEVRVSVQGLHNVWRQRLFSFVNESLRLLDLRFIFPVATIPVADSYC